MVPKAEIVKHVQLVLSDPTPLSEGRNFGVLSTKTWRLADMGAKHAFLRAGFGWGQMPLHMVEKDIREGALVKIRVEGAPARTQILPMHAVHRKDAPPGPAGQSLIDWLGDIQPVKSGLTASGRHRTRPVRLRRDYYT